MIDYTGGSPTYGDLEISWGPWTDDEKECKLNTYEFICTDPSENRFYYSSYGNGAVLQDNSESCKNWIMTDLYSQNKISVDVTKFTQNDEGTYRFRIVGFMTINAEENKLGLKKTKYFSKKIQADCGGSNLNSVTVTGSTIGPLDVKIGVEARMQIDLASLFQVKFHHTCFLSYKLID